MAAYHVESSFGDHDVETDSPEKAILASLECHSVGGRVNLYHCGFYAAVFDRSRAPSRMVCRYTDVSTMLKALKTDANGIKTGTMTTLVFPGRA